MRRDRDAAIRAVEDAASASERRTAVISERTAAVRRLGHLPLRQGDAVECYRCGASGRIDIKGEILGPGSERLTVYPCSQ